MDKDILLEKLLTKLKSQVSLVSYGTIFKDLKIYSYNNNEVILTIEGNNDLLLQTISKNYSNIIEDIINDITNDTCSIKYVPYEDLNKIEEKNKIIETIENNTQTQIDDEIKNYKYSSNFNPKYTFDTFVVGESNKLAYGTALAVAQNPGKLYNPYFIYAKSGLGKTHLMHAIGNYIVNNSDKKVLYIRADQFCNDYISIMNMKNTNNISYLEAFREKYRNVDVLMIDDIQGLDQKTQSQFEFTNTFNSLYDDEKQIIIASDTSIDDYKKLEDRLKTRFKWGLTETINPPEIELKINIIKNKLKTYNNYYEFSLNNEVINYVANNCGSNIRNLENALTRLQAYKATLHIEEFTVEIAKEALQEFVTDIVYHTNSISNIISVVAKYYGLDSSMLKGKMKKKNVADARSIAMYLSRLMTDNSLERIGLEFGGRDHSTVIYSYEKISKELQNNLKLQEEIKILKDKISISE